MQEKSTILQIKEHGRLSSGLEFGISFIQMCITTLRFKNMSS